MLWIDELEAAYIKLVLEENLYIVDLLILAKVPPDLISERQNSFDDLLLVFKAKLIFSEAFHLSSVIIMFLAITLLHSSVRTP